MNEPKTVREYRATVNTNHGQVVFTNSDRRELDNVIGASLAYRQKLITFHELTTDTPAASAWQVLLDGEPVGCISSYFVDETFSIANTIKTQTTRQKAA